MGSGYKAHDTGADGSGKIKKREATVAPDGRRQ
jgi:hypothetical protein